MAVMIVNRNNVFTNLSKIISLLDAYEEVKISYVASDGDGANDETSYGWEITSFKSKRWAPSKARLRDDSWDDRRSRPAPWAPSYVRPARDDSGEKRSYSERKSFGKSRDGDTSRSKFWAPKTWGFAGERGRWGYKKGR